jgi:4-amino-4-deoxy-L-arabinose transferase-like glycosyltransferase
MMKFFLDKKIIVLFFIALILRLLMFLPVLVQPEVAYVTGAIKETDASSYQLLGTELYKNNVYSFPYRTPGYPFFLSLFYKIIGNPNPILPVIFQIIFSALLVFFIVDLGEMIFNKTVGFLSGLIYAIAPLSALYANKLMTETLASIFYFLTIYSIYNALQGKSWRKWLWLGLGGLFFSIALIIAPSGLYLLYILPFVIIFLIIFRDRDKEFLKRMSVSIASGLLFFILGAAIVFSWALRNEAVYGVRFLSTLSSANFYFNYAGMALAQAKGISLQQALPELSELLQKENIGDIYNNPHTIKNVNKLSFNIIKDHPFSYIFTHCKYTLKRLFGLQEGLGYKSQFLYFIKNSGLLFLIAVSLYIFHFIYFFIFAILLCLGYWWLISNIKKQIGLLLILLVSIYFLFIFGPVFDVRYRLIALPIDAIIVGFTTFLVLEKIKNKYVRIKSIWK